MAHVAHCTALTELDLGGCTRVSSSGVHTLCTLRHLASLTLDGVFMAVATAQQAHALFAPWEAGLTRLHMAHCKCVWYCCGTQCCFTTVVHDRQLSNATLSGVLRALPRLRSLDLTGNSQITTAACLLQCTALTSLSLDACDGMTDTTVHAARLPALHTLSLAHHTRLTDLGMCMVACLTCVLPCLYTQCSRGNRSRETVVEGTVVEQPHALLLMTHAHASMQMWLH